MRPFCDDAECVTGGPHVHREGELFPYTPVDFDLTDGEWAGTDLLKEWWIEQARVEADKLAPKAIEYGSYDLAMVGEVLGEMVHRPANMEMGIIFYLIGKVARLASAMRDGNTPSDDTFLDIAIYARMALYIREHGQWP